VKVLVADSSMVTAGVKAWGEEFSLALQVQGRAQRGGRTKARKRVVGFGIGHGLWTQALGGVPEPELIVTDRERGLRQLIGRYFPGARHQQCEWHLARTLGYTLSLQGMHVAERKRLVATVIGTLRQSPEAARDGYRTLQERVRAYPRATTFLRNSARYVLYESNSAERTTGLVEREMRELNRRTDVGARWSLEGVASLVRLRLAQRHNPDDYERIWSAYGSPAATWCLTDHVN
jgi:transposase-like protein